MKLLFAKSVCLILLLSNILTATADEPVKLSTQQVIQATISGMPSCLKYKVIGLCFWKVCAGPYCWVEETLKVDQYLPDAVVSIYRKEDSNPWDYPHTIVDPLAYQIGQTQIKSISGFDMGSGYQSSSQPEEQHTHFKEADLIGNPTIAIFNASSDVFLPSQATPFMPYYLSQADGYIWRSPLIEMALYPSSLVPGMHIVGSLINSWGSVYPRTGFLDQPIDAKGAAVIAQRAADIATRGMQPHIYQPLNATNSCGDHCDVWEAKENDPNTQWQLIYPTLDTTCMTFGINDTLQPTPWKQAEAVKGDGNYAWIMWRHYRGCIPDKGGTYIGSIDFNN